MFKIILTQTSNSNNTPQKLQKRYLKLNHHNIYQ